MIGIMLIWYWKSRKMYPVVVLVATLGVWLGLINQLQAEHLPSLVLLTVSVIELLPNRIIVAKSCTVQYFKISHNAHLYLALPLSISTDVFFNGECSPRDIMAHPSIVFLQLQSMHLFHAAFILHEHLRWILFRTILDLSCLLFSCTESKVLGNWLFIWYSLMPSKI